MNTATTITSLESGKTLSKEEAYDLQRAILQGAIDTQSLLALFGAMEGRSVTKDELCGFFRASSDAMTKLPASEDTLDTCGTGGDHSGSFNISTAAALVIAAAGVPVAKHGNRAASSTCGSADVLEALGVKIDIGPEQAKKVLDETGFVFLFARSYHPAFRHAAEARKAFGKRTYFNLLGPLLNPAQARYRVHGLADFSLAPILAAALDDSRVQRMWLVRAEDGMDEISPACVTKVIERAEGAPRSFTVDPKAYGLAADAAGLKGGDAPMNARILTDILQGKGTEAQNVAVVLNAAAGLTVYGKTSTYEEGISLAKATIASGKGYDTLREVIRESNSV